jgi:16S rRNA (guanine(966)-N(2))-methyltransferase RsmD
MRVISGIYRGRVLKSPPDRKTRPTSDRLRETLFNILAPRIHEETRFLDLCAGSGAIGIEALSRGAAFATFVDKSRRSCALIEENLDLLQVPESETEVINLQAETFAARKPEIGWDIIFFDPPYALDYNLVLNEFRRANNGLLRDGGLFIVEHHSKTEMPDQLGELRRWRILKQGETRLSFYEDN